MKARKRAVKNSSKRKRSSRRAPAKKRNRTKPAASETNAVAFDQYRDWFLPDAGSFAGLAFHGNTSWSPPAIVWLALCWAWSASKNLTDAFDEAKRQCAKLGIAGLKTYSGFMAALTTWTDSFLKVLWPLLHRRMREINRKLWRIDGWVLIAFDGSRSSTPRTESNEQALCAPNYGRGATAKYRKKKTKGLRRRKNEKAKSQPQEPQVWITLMWHVGLRLPWMWKLGPSSSSERDHVRQMLDEGDYPKNTLFCGDAGFVGYPLWSRILDRGHHFLVRVGANVHLLREASGFNKTSGGRVLSWPQEALRAGQSPLRLRLVKIKLGKTKAWMLTSVLEPSRLSKAQIVKYYKMRWGIEVEFRGLKQTLDRAKLRCRNDRRVLVELNWSILAMAVAELFALKEQASPRRGRRRKSDPPPDPKRRSLANTIRALRRCLQELNEIPESGRDLATQLRHAVTDDYHRKSSKKARYRPPNPDKKPLSDPKIRALKPSEKRKLKHINHQTNAA